MSIEHIYDHVYVDDLAAAIWSLDPLIGEDSLVQAIAPRDRLDARIAEAVGALPPGVCPGVCRGGASGSQVEAIVAQLDDEVMETFVALEAELVPYLVPLTSTLSRLFCDGAVHRVVISGRSAILDYGTATRTIPAAVELPGHP